MILKSSLCFPPTEKSHGACSEGEESGCPLLRNAQCEKQKQEQKDPRVSDRRSKEQTLKALRGTEIFFIKICQKRFWKKVLFVIIYIKLYPSCVMKLFLECDDCRQLVLIGKKKDSYKTGNPAVDGIKVTVFQHLELLDGSVHGLNLVTAPLFLQLLSSDRPLLSRVAYRSLFSQLLFEVFILLLQIRNLGLLREVCH